MLYNPNKGFVRVNNNKNNKKKKKKKKKNHDHHETATADYISELEDEALTPLAGLARCILASITSMRSRSNLKSLTASQ
ncbi:hypothetical protein Pmar_PMAR012850 [Perkinsus marinus ATCC 50983]|uniref:Uncharacterized protein n=1 Tax=Perkinsus marinus (strain ATCC 50983 / TXsc) TaxID=423536 RepID=C5LPY7_PERM5|nr:hypothetical protein Pmar_PMAR012850 [Perkinsus marinus ATCC 50983]EER01206.1 hypothetical protein Pmar_PMAR012850 [Perkinsus marinus ATCC 50983]|eukprot:XP_002768488.1 hypothetical protein Pmar_PMAR012850 [Perkinsus marinus ATCC 50983]